MWWTLNTKHTEFWRLSAVSKRSARQICTCFSYSSPFLQITVRLLRTEHQRGERNSYPISLGPHKFLVCFLCQFHSYLWLPGLPKRGYQCSFHSLHGSCSCSSWRMAIWKTINYIGKNRIDSPVSHEAPAVTASSSSSQRQPTPMTRLFMKCWGYKKVFCDTIQTPGMKQRASRKGCLTATSTFVCTVHLQSLLYSNL